MGPWSPRAGAEREGTDWPLPVYLPPRTPRVPALRAAAGWAAGQPGAARRGCWLACPGVL